MDEVSHVGAVRKLFEETRRRLVETGTRNRLVHVNRQNRRSNSLEVINERSEDVFQLLVSSGKTMRFLATGQDKGGETDTPSLATNGTVSEVESRFTDSQLETRLGPDGLQKRLLKLVQDAKTAEEEQGVNILFLALGFLTWFEADTSDVKREAPLLLIPVELVRNQRTSTYDVRFRDDEISANLPLQERLKADFGIDLPDLHTADEWTPSAYYREVEESISGRKRWNVDRDGMQLGFFSFAKLIMFRDLDPKNWADNALEKHALTTGLLYERFESEEPLFGNEDRLDEKLPPARLFHVVDADASQAKVIEEVRSGRNLVVQGPPGTGKSQTITNIIAAAVRDGKRVLFVAEKMAALSVVHKRLVDVGLSDICLELHSRSANKKAVLAELAKTLNSGRASPTIPDPPDKLHAARDKLNVITGDLHRKVGQSGESAFAAMAQQIHFMGKGAPPPRLAADAFAHIHATEAKRLASAIVAYGNAVTKAGPLQDHPFFGVGRLDLQPTDLARLDDRLKSVAAGAAELSAEISAAAIALGTVALSTLGSVHPLATQLSLIDDAPAFDDDALITLIMLPEKARLRENLELGLRWQSARKKNDLIFKEAAWKSDAMPLGAPLAAGRNSLFLRWSSAYRRASRGLEELLRNPIPKSATERAELVNILISTATLREQWRADEAWCSKVLNGDWRSEETAFAAILDAVAWAEQIAFPDMVADPKCIIALARDSQRRRTLQRALASKGEATQSALSELVREFALNLHEGVQADSVAESDLGVVEYKARSLTSNMKLYDEWVNLQRLRNQLQTGTLETLLPALGSGKISGAAAETEFLYARAEAIWKKALIDNPALNDLRNVDRHEVVDSFQKLEKDRRRDCVNDIRANHLNQVPQGAQGAQGQMGFIRGEIGKKKAHASIRKLILQAGEAVQRIKPVLMMSPISVAQFLPPNSVSFDLLLIDEASQVRPEDALGAIARARQIVVVGDQKQLPPSSFFDRLGSSEGGDDDDDASALLEGVAKIGDLESILTLCEARGLPTRMLEWHYRSRDPSLIRVSNREFYGDGLILPPSPLQGDPDFGLIFTHARGVYDRGGKRDNRIEAEALISRVAEHAGRFPDQSLGIVTFSMAQANLITELLEYRRRQDTTLDRFLREGRSEDIFIKNIENVQGDERDVILVSVGYGPTVPGGKPAMSFGPVNNEGGERRLNVLFTRARTRCEVFCSFDPGEMDLSKTRLEGPRVLKRFLEFAKTGIIEDKTASNAGPDTPFEADIADEIRKLGYLVDHQVGTVGFLIDLGVRHPERPGKYILAVECDGATYHSALWARERDRLRQEVLEHLGWKFHRIWSTDWFYRRPSELERLRDALDRANNEVDPDSPILGANTDDWEAVQEVSHVPTLEVLSLDVSRQRSIPSYRRANISVQNRGEPHEMDLGSLARIALKIVEAEGPIHEEEVARRIAFAFGKEKAGSRILSATQRALLTALRFPGESVLHDGAFWFTDAQSKNPPVRDRSEESAPTNKTANISPLEAMRCLEFALEDNAGGSNLDIIRAAARLLGYKRLGMELQAKLESCVDEMVKLDRFGSRT